VTETVGRLDGRLPEAVATELARLRAENARLLRLLELTPEQAGLPRPAQSGFFEAPPGPVHGGSTPGEKVAFFAGCLQPAPMYTRFGTTTAAPARLDGFRPRGAASTGAFRTASEATCR
jgi:hypothetical protein